MNNTLLYSKKRRTKRILEEKQTHCGQFSSNPLISPDPATNLSPLPAEEETYDSAIRERT
jgi:hypothetical protein